MTNNANGFSLIGRTTLVVDDQIVYTSEVNPLTGQVEEKDMVVTGQLVDELGTNLSNRKIRVQYEMVNGDGAFRDVRKATQISTDSLKLIVNFQELLLVRLESRLLILHGIMKIMTI